MSHQANRAALFGSKASGAGATNNAPKVSVTKSSTATTNTSTTAEPAAAKPVSQTANIKPTSSTSSSSSSSSSSNKIGFLSPEAQRKKNAEIQQLMERANAALKTSLFQWSPDYLVAAPLFEQIADLHKQLHNVTNAIEFYQKASDAHEKCKAISSAALALTKAANLAIEAQMEVEAPRLLQGVAQYWAAYGDIPRYGETLFKIGQQVK